MDRLQLVSVLAAVCLLVVVLELVRRRRLLERYALLWLLAALVMLGLAGWRGALVRLAQSLGIFSPPNALFFVAVGFVVVLLLHFSAAVSRLTDQSKILAQRLAIMEQRVQRMEAGEREEDDADAVLVEREMRRFAGSGRARERS
jgi:hypothetical protein